MDILPAVTWRSRLRSLSLSLLICIAAALLAWIFVLLGSDRTEGETRVFDRVILRSMQALRDGHTWAVPILRDLSAISANSAARSS